MMKLSLLATCQAVACPGPRLEGRGEWGDAKLLMHKGTGKGRLVLRQEKTMTVVRHFYMNFAQYCVLRQSANSD